MEDISFAFRKWRLHSFDEGPIKSANFFFCGRVSRRGPQLYRKPRFTGHGSSGRNLLHEEVFRLPSIGKKL